MASNCLLAPAVDESAESSLQKYKNFNTKQQTEKKMKIYCNTYHEKRDPLYCGFCSADCAQRESEPIKWSTVTYIRLKRVRPTRSRCIRLLRRWKTGLLLERIPFEEGGSLEDFFWFLRCKGAFFAENSTIRYTDLLKETGYSISEEKLQPHTGCEYSVATDCCLQGQPIFRITRKLSIQGNEATLNVCFEFHRQAPHFSFLLRLIFSEYRYHHGAWTPLY